MGFTAEGRDSFVAVKETINFSDGSYLHRGQVGLILYRKEEEILVKFATNYRLTIGERPESDLNDDQYAEKKETLLGTLKLKTDQVLPLAFQNPVN